MKISLPLLALILSIAIHIILTVSTLQLNTNAPKLPEKHKVEFQIIEQKNNSSSQNSKITKQKINKQKKLKQSNKVLSLRQLTTNNTAEQFAKKHIHSIQNKKELTGGYANEGSYNKFSESQGAFGVMNSMGAAEYAKNIWFYELLWNKINSGTTYPIDLANQRISGTVNVHALLNHKGQLVNFLEITGPENLLKAYVMTNLIHTLKKPITKKHWLKDKKEIPVLITFHFITHELVSNKYHSVDFSDQGNHLKNTLLIKKRRVINNRVAQYYSERIAPYIPPIIPIPGGFIIDFVAAYKMIDTWGEPIEPVRRKRRLKNLKKLLSNTIKKQPANYKTKSIW